MPACYGDYEENDHTEYDEEDLLEEVPPDSGGGGGGVAGGRAALQEAKISTLRVEGQKVGGRKMYRCSRCPNIKLITARKGARSRRARSRRARRWTSKFYESAM